jgi:phosphohistidine phosphatase
MKTIYIARHAKSSWNQADLPDEKRPLLEKGRKRTKKVIDFLHENKVTVDETAKLLARGLKYPAENIRINKQIYFASGDSLIDQFYDLPSNINSVMIVGHNPTLTDFANQFLVSPIENLPTSGVVSISFDTDQWEKIPFASRKTNFILFPKEIEGK